MMLMLMRLLPFPLLLKGRGTIVGQWRKWGVLQEVRGWIPTAVVIQSPVVVERVIHNIEVAHLVFSIRAREEAMTAGLRHSEG